MSFCCFGTDSVQNKKNKTPEVPIPSNIRVDNRTETDQNQDQNDLQAVDQKKQDKVEEQNENILSQGGNTSNVVPQSTNIVANNTSQDKKNTSNNIISKKQNGFWCCRSSTVESKQGSNPHLSEPFAENYPVNLDNNIPDSTNEVQSINRIRTVQEFEQNSNNNHDQQRKCTQIEYFYNSIMYSQTFERQYQESVDSSSTDSHQTFQFPSSANTEDYFGQRSFSQSSSASTSRSFQTKQVLTEFGFKVFENIEKKNTNIEYFQVKNMEVYQICIYDNTLLKVTLLYERNRYILVAKMMNSQQNAQNINQLVQIMNHYKQKYKGNEKLDEVPTKINQQNQEKMMQYIIINANDLKN